MSVNNLTDLQRIFLLKDEIFARMLRYHHSSPLKDMPMTQILLQERQPSELSLYIIREVARQYNEFSCKSQTKLFPFSATLIHAN